jgi:hypothetical protein
VKLKSLAAESKIIRYEEQKMKARAACSEISEESRARAKRELVSLREHRCWDVRRHTRHSHLAYAFIRGVAYRAVELTVRENNEPNWDTVADIAARFLWPYTYNRPPNLKPLTAKKLQEWKEVAA